MPNRLYDPDQIRWENRHSFLDKLYTFLAFLIILVFALFPQTVVWVWQQMFVLLDLIFSSPITPKP